MGGEGRQRRRPKQGYFYEAHNKDMEMKHLYATGGPSLCSRSGPTTSSLVSAPLGSRGGWRARAEMNERNNPTVRRERAMGRVTTV